MTTHTDNHDNPTPGSSEQAAAVTLTEGERQILGNLSDISFGAIESWTRLRELGLIEPNANSGNYWVLTDFGKCVLAQQPPAENATAFEYATLNRPAMYGTVPEGFTVISSPHDDNGLEIISYEHQLTDDQLKRYELIPVNDNAYSFKIGDRVLVNDCDEATIIGFATRGRYKVIYAFDETTEDCVKHTCVSAVLSQQPPPPTGDGQPTGEATDTQLRNDLFNRVQDTLAAALYYLPGELAEFPDKVQKVTEDFCNYRNLAEKQIQERDIEITRLRGLCELAADKLALPNLGYNSPLGLFVKELRQAAKGETE